MADLIDRQAAITMPVMPKKYRKYQTMNLDDAYEQGWDDCQKCIDKLPSAEPERAIKDCRNCKHGNYNDRWDTYFCYHSDDCNDWDKWEPSAEPDAPDKNVGDIISRQEIFRAFEEMCSCTDYGWDERDFRDLIKKIPSAQPEPCEFCRNRRLEDGDTLYISADWDGGIGFDYIRDIHYCPRCGRRLQMWKEIING